MNKPDLTPRQNARREGLSKKYYAQVEAMSQYGGRLLIIKGWSVTRSLAALG